ncbi:MAG: pyruvate kinase [bacterium]|nr:pyruvate kinase [bacterium]
MHSRAQIIATIGPACMDVSILSALIAHEMDVARLNFAWGDVDEHTKALRAIREAEKVSGRKIVVILDVPGPRIQNTGSHTYDTHALSSLTEEDKRSIAFGVEHRVDYIAQSFVGNATDIARCREVIRACGGTQRIIAKIERKIALESLDEIIASADAVMVARGDLGSELPLEQIPFIQEKIIRSAKTAGKPVITATQMLLSMVKEQAPSRAEVTDVAYAILQGSDAVMLSEETAIGKYPIETVAMMEKIVLEAERHMGRKETITPLVSIHV